MQEIFNTVIPIPLWCLLVLIFAGGLAGVLSMLAAVVSLSKKRHIEAMIPTNLNEPVKVAELSRSEPIKEVASVPEPAIVLRKEKRVKDDIGVIKLSLESQVELERRAGVGENYSILDLAAILGISRGDISRLVQSGELVAITAYNKAWITADSVAGMVARRVGV